MDWHPLTMAHLQDRDRQTFDPKDENAYYRAALVRPWPVETIFRLAVLLPSLARRILTALCHGLRRALPKKTELG